MKNFLSIAIASITLFMLFSCGVNNVHDYEDESSVSSTNNSIYDEYIFEVSEEPANYVTGSNSNSPNEDVNDILSKLDVKSYATLDGDVCVFITNNSNTVIDELEAQINYYDDTDNIIDLYTDGHDMILPGYTVVSKMAAPLEYARFETTCDIELECNLNYENHSDEVSISANSGDNCVIIQITNNSSVTIEEIEYIVVFYKNDEIVEVSYPEDINDLDSGDTVIEKESILADYDRFEVYLNQAHTFGLW